MPTHKLSPSQTAHGLPSDWVSDWPLPTGVQAACSLRYPGSSQPPYDGLNLGAHVGDNAAQVAANRLQWARSVGAQPVFMDQVHGWAVQTLDGHTEQGVQADACITQARGLVCTIMVADCLPVLFVGEAGHWVGAAHAGWRGLAGEQGQGVLEATLQALQDQAGLQAHQLRVWLGPCIGPQAFEVGDEVRLAMTTGHPHAQAAFKPAQQTGKWMADLALLARQRLQTMGVVDVSGNDSSPQWCTVGRADLFFSHRRDRVSGRMAVGIWRSDINGLRS